MPLTSAASVPIIDPCSTPVIDSRPASVPDLAHYIIVRADLPHGSQVAQATHAAGESIAGPVPSGTIAVALAARDRAHLDDLAAKLAAAAISHVVIRESDGEPMAIGCTPTHDRAAVRKVLSSVPLVR